MQRRKAFRGRHTNSPRLARCAFWTCESLLLRSPVPAVAVAAVPALPPLRFRSRLRHGRRAIPHVRAPAVAAPPFSASSPDGGLPAGWKPLSCAAARARRATHGRVGGHTVLSARAESTRRRSQCEVDIDLAKTPWLQWQWRVDALMAGACIDDEVRDDSPARLVLAFRAASQRLTLGDLMFFEQIELFTGQRLPNTRYSTCGTPSCRSAPSPVMHARGASATSWSRAVQRTSANG